MSQFQYNPENQDLPDQKVDPGLAAMNCCRLYERANQEILEGRFEDAQDTCDEAEALWIDHIAPVHEVRVYALKVSARSALLNWRIAQILEAN